MGIISAAVAGDRPYFCHYGASLTVRRRPTNRSQGSDCGRRGTFGLRHRSGRDKPFTAVWPGGLGSRLLQSSCICTPNFKPAGPGRMFILVFAQAVKGLFQVDGKHLYDGSYALTNEETRYRCWKTKEMG